MSHILHQSFLNPTSFTVKHLMAGLLGIALSLCLLFIGASNAASNQPAPEDQGEVSQEDQEFRDLIFDRTHRLWIAKEGGPADPRKLPNVAAPPPSATQPDPEDEPKK